MASSSLVGRKWYPGGRVKGGREITVNSSGETLPEQAVAIIAAESAKQPADSKVIRLFARNLLVNLTVCRFWRGEKPFELPITSYPAQQQDGRTTLPRSALPPGR